MPVLVFTHGPLAGTRLEVGDEEITIGRRASNDVVLRDPGVSRLHAILLRRLDVTVLEDLGSHNGSFVNGERVGSPRQLRHGDKIQIGASRALFEDPLQTGEDTTEVAERGLGPQAFTERQLQVLRLVARGLANKEIARRLGVSERTVKAYLSSAFDKLGVNSRSGAVTAALRLGLIDLPGSDDRA